MTSREKYAPRPYQRAAHRSTADVTRIKALLKQTMTDQIDNREIFMKCIDYSYYYEQSDEVIVE